jgi:DNA-binding XRE family transcriptional regulator
MCRRHYGPTHSQLRTLRNEKWPGASGAASQGEDHAPGLSFPVANWRNAPGRHSGNSQADGREQERRRRELEADGKSNSQSSRSMPSTSGLIVLPMRFMSTATCMCRDGGIAPRIRQLQIACGLSSLNRAAAPSGPSRLSIKSETVLMSYFMLGMILHRWCMVNGAVDQWCAKLHGRCTSPDMAATRRSPGAKEANAALRKAVGEHLRAVREVLGLAQGEFGRRAGLATNTYNMIENGTKMPSVLTAIAICDAHGLTLDYVFRGDPSDLAPTIRRALDALHTARHQSPTG